MSKGEFLQLLKLRLLESNVTPTQGVLNYYSQRIDAGMRNGLSEDKAVAEQGDIDEIVAKAILDMATPASIARSVRECEEANEGKRKKKVSYEDDYYEDSEVKGKSKAAFWITLCTFPIWFPLFMGLGGTALGLLIALWAVGFSLVVVVAALGVAAVGTLLGSFTVVFGMIPIAGFIGLIGASLFLAGLSAILWTPATLAMKGIMKLSLLPFKGIKRAFSSI